MRDPLLKCLRDPVPEIAEATGLLEGAASAHLAGDQDTAKKLIRAADLQAIRDWTESLWGARSPYVRVRRSQVVAAIVPVLAKARMPSKDIIKRLHERDGFHCRFFGIPVIENEVRLRIQMMYPDALNWGRRNIEQHAAFQAMRAQYDHVLPHSRGGLSDETNVIVTCAPCNFARMEHTLEEVGLADPRDRQPTNSSWQGLRQFK